MRSTLITLGTLGDVRPLVALGVALSRAGHTAKIATHGAYEDLVRRHGLQFHRLPGEPDTLLQTATGQSLLAAGRNPVSNLRHLARLAEELLDAIVAESTAASRDADLILGTAPALMVGGLHAGEKLGVPVAGAFLQPLHPTRDFASVLFPAWPFGRGPGRGTYNRLSHRALGQLAWQLIRRRLDRSRRDVLGLARMSRRGPAGELGRPDRLWLYGYSPALLPRPGEWPDSALVTGYWFLDRDAGWQPPELLADFLASGPEPVYVGFGSAGSYRGGDTTQLAVEALRMTRQRGVIAAPGQEAAVRVVADDVVAVNGVPHDWLFPSTSLVVHHVGLGTLETALRASRTAVLVPHCMDEPFWAQRLVQLGVSPRPLPRLQLTATRLAGRLRLALSDEAMRERARRLGSHIAAEQGAQRAVAAIEAHLSPG